MAKETKEKVVNLQTRVAVVATEKHPFATKGEKFDVSLPIAEKFLKDGYIEKYKAPANDIVEDEIEE
jgi:hypothetical protein